MKIKEKYKIREIAGEKIVILEKDQQVEFTHIMVLNNTSEWLWKQLKGVDFDVKKAARLLLSKYDVDESTALADSQNWIDTMKKHDIIEEK